MTISPKRKKIWPSMGSQPQSIILFQGSYFTSVATGELSTLITFFQDWLLSWLLDLCLDRLVKNMHPTLASKDLLYVVAILSLPRIVNYLIHWQCTLKHHCYIEHEYMCKANSTSHTTFCHHWWSLYDTATSQQLSSTYLIFHHDFSCFQRADAQFSAGSKNCIWQWSQVQYA